MSALLDEVTTLAEFRSWRASATAQRDHQIAEVIDRLVDQARRDAIDQTNVLLRQQYAAARELAATLDSLHPNADGRCPTCRLAWPCPTAVVRPTLVGQRPLAAPPPPAAGQDTDDALVDLDAIRLVVAEEAERHRPDSEGRCPSCWVVETDAVGRVFAVRRTFTPCRTATVLASLPGGRP